jgi:hypothetical protein
MPGRWALAGVGHQAHGEDAIGAHRALAVSDFAGEISRGVGSLGEAGQPEFGAWAFGCFLGDVLRCAVDRFFLAGSVGLGFVVHDRRDVGNCVGLQVLG